jgi:hypothetical protein
MEPDDAPWLNLSPEEIQQLRTNKQHLTEYGKQKIRELMNHEEMLEIAAEREAANEAIIAKVSEEDYQKVMDAAKENKVLDIAKNIMEENKEAFQHLAAIERKEFAEKDFEDLTRDQKIQLALEEIDWIVIGGQDGEEFYGSIQFLRKVLRSLV